MAKQKKIIFAGLDNGGKSSIIMSLQSKFSLLAGLRPTIGISRTEMQELKCLGMELLAWDFGGQKNFRDTYFAQKFRVFGGATAMFYIIDIKDSDARFQESLQYLKDIIETFTLLKETPAILICFNKFDPDIPNKKNLEDKVKDLQDRILNINQNFDIGFYRTSIFDPSSLIKVFSEGVLKGSPKATLISGFLKEYAKLTFSSAVILLDDNSLILGSHYSNPKYLEIIETVAPRFITAIEKIGNYNLIPENVMVNLRFTNGATELTENGEDQEKEALIFLRTFKTANGLSFTIVTLTRNKSTFKLSDNYLPELAIRLSEFMQTINTQ